MIGIGRSKYIASILILIDFAVALNSDGFCTFVETYTEPVTSFQTYKTTVPFSKKCGIFGTRICYDYRERINYQHVVNHVKKTINKNKCCEGYLQKDTKCVPVCSVPCLNGICTEPDVCTCSSGYHKNSGVCSKNDCDPSTPENSDCPNGTCTSNGDCICNDGFVKNETTLGGIESNLSKCVPICSEGCLNGNCISPENCVCNAGYEALNSSVCSPICEKGCVFGICTEPNICTCLEGYQLTNESNHFCYPVCSGGCLNGFCYAPDLCQCKTGFELNDETKQCDPYCVEECVNSNCSSPNICSCHTGFSQINSTHCEISCENCTNGYCVEANVCQCDIGYHKNNNDGKCDQNECIPNMLEDSCQNGYCSDDGICMCNSGYEKNSSAVCEPTCSLECVNGYCSEPEVCQCFHGYDLSASNDTGDGNNCTNCTNFTSWNICNAVCDGCENGTCIEGICNCFDGYIQHPSSRGKCILPTELVNLEIKQSKSAYLGVLITVVLVGIALSVLGGFVYWRYFRQNSYKCNAVAEAIYYKHEKSSLL